MGSLRFPDCPGPSLITERSLPVNILTFDIEEWFHILDVDAGEDVSRWNSYESRIEAGTNRIMELLARGEQRATFFCLGWVAQRYPHVVRAIHDAGMEIGSHTFFHPLLYRLTPEQFREELKRSVETLEDCTGTKVRAFRAPGFSLTHRNIWVVEELARQGITVDSSIFPTVRSHGGFSGFGAASPALVEMGGMRIKEFPINLASFGHIDLVFSGGGYFRLLPYFLVRAMFRRSPYVMTYFHPRDFDPGQPVLERLPPMRRFKSYVGLRTAKAKLEKLLGDFSFCDLRRAEEMVDWATCKMISLSDR